jgi:hypothetical protein
MPHDMAGAATSAHPYIPRFSDRLTVLRNSSRLNTSDEHQPSPAFHGLAGRYVSASPSTGMFVPALAALVVAMPATLRS